MNGPVALIGANGMLARAVQTLAPVGTSLLLYDLPELDITREDQVKAQLLRDGPQLIINCAAYTQVDKCEEEQATAYAVNGRAPGYLAQTAADCGACLIHISTDFVFSGEQKAPFQEEDPVGPLSVYGASKLAGEQAVIDSGLENYYILRTSWLYGPGGANFVETIIRLAGEREELGIVADQIGSPTYSFDLARAIWALVERLDTGHPVDCGIYHYSNLGECSWYDLAQAVVAYLQQQGEPPRLQQLKPIPTSAYPLPAPRPAYSVLAKDKIISALQLEIPYWHDSLQQYLNRRNQLDKG